LLAAAVLQAQQSAFGEDAYATIADKAAAYGFFLVQNHPFNDGNKRTGFVAMAAFLDVNGYEIIAEDDDTIAQMFEDVAAGIIDQGEFFGWVVNHTRRRSDADDASNVVSMRSK
jgi:death-on-curing protein